MVFASVQLLNSKAINDRVKSLNISEIRKMLFRESCSSKNFARIIERIMKFKCITTATEKLESFQQENDTLEH